MLQHSIYQIAKTTREDLQKLIDNYFHPDWACSCAICSWQLTRVLKKFYYNATFAIGEYWKITDRGNYFLSDHAFVIVDSQIVDITATQFHLKEIEIRKFDDKHYVVNHLGKLALNSLFKDWPLDQQPTPYKKYLNKAFEKTINKLI